MTEEKATIGAKVTNGYYVGQTLTKFQIIALCNNYVWVKPIAGSYTKEGPLTFHIDDLDLVE